MAVMDHRESDGICIWDHRPWPCTTAQVRQDLAEYLRNVSSGMSPLSEAADHVLAGIAAAATLIDID